MHFGDGVSRRVGSFACGALARVRVSSLRNVILAGRAVAHRYPPTDAVHVSARLRTPLLRYEYDGALYVWPHVRECARACVGAPPACSAVV